MTITSNVGSSSCHEFASKSIYAMFSVPFKTSPTELTTKVDISGTTPLSEVLETATMEEFIINLSTARVVDETDTFRIGSVIPIKVSLHRSELSVELHITSSLSPSLHTKAFGDGDNITAPVTAIIIETLN